MKKFFLLFFFLLLLPLFSKAQVNNNNFSFGSKFSYDFLGKGYSIEPVYNIDGISDHDTILVFDYLKQKSDFSLGIIGSYDWKLTDNFKFGVGTEFGYQKWLLLYADKMNAYYLSPFVKILYNIDFNKINTFFGVNIGAKIISRSPYYNNAHSKRYFINPNIGVETKIFKNHLLSLSLGIPFSVGIEKIQRRDGIGNPLPDINYYLSYIGYNFVLMYSL